MSVRSLVKRFAMVFALLALAPSAMAQEPLKIGFVYVGPIGDFGWSYEHERGRQALEAEFGDAVKTTFVEKVREGADAERVIRQLAQRGNQLIFSTSFGFMNPAVKVAKRFPKVTFENATGYKLGRNISNYTLRTYEGRWISGVAAGMLTKSNTVGFIASFPIPEVIRDINAFYLGAKSVNPNVKVKIIWVSTWYDPLKESEAANALIDQGADVLVQHTDSPAALAAAEKRGVRAIGQASDMSKFAPKAHVLSIQNNWSPHYIRTVKALQDGTWKPRQFWGGFADDMLLVSSVNDNLPQNVKDAIAKAKADLASRKFHPFTGPLYSNEGKLVVKAGETIKDEDLGTINWYVKGIDAKLPK